LLQKYDSSGRLLKIVTLSGQSKGANYLALDDAGGALWLAGNRDLVKLSLSAPEQAPLLTIVAPVNASGIAVDGQTGELWLLGQKDLFSFTREGAPRVSRDLKDFSISNTQSLAFDFGSQAVWVAHQKGLSRIATTGALVKEFPADGKVVAMALGRAPLNIKPVVSIVAPQDAALLNTGTPLFRVTYDALCGTATCGFPPSFFRSFALTASIDGVQVGSSFVFDAATGGATFTPNAALSEGSHTWSAQARDTFGKTSETVSASFTIDTLAPAFRNVAPPSGSSFAVASIAITGSIDDPAGVVALGGQSQGQTFSFPIVLSSGLNQLSLVARDRAGNTAILPLTYVFNLPPTVSITSPAGGDNFTAPAAFAVTAAATDADGSIARVEFFKDGLSLGSDTTFPYNASITDLALGTYVLTARATDDRGATSASPPVTISVGPPNARPAVQWKSPATGTQFSAPADIRVLATATDTDGTIAKVEFFRNGVLAATVTAEPYAATLNGVPAGTHTLTARATDDRGGATTTAPVTISVAQTLINITRPLPGAFINSTSVMVAGSIVALPNSGLSVNDEPASRDALGNFFVNVPLQAGANTITAKLTTGDGTVLTKSVSVNASGTAPPFAIVASPASGLAPLAATFTAFNASTFDGSFTFNGAGPFSLQAGRSLQLTATFPAGVFNNTVVFTDTGGRTFTAEVVVESSDLAQMDQMFRAIWNNFNNALIAGDKDGAMRYLNSSAQEKFGPAFDVLMPFMAQIVASYSPFARSEITNRIATYAVSRVDNGQKRLYMIYFMLGRDGVWRIDEM
ncbi:MAG: Ig-like domain-containing protein, partial [Acidobacteriota bacterium]